MEDIEDGEFGGYYSESGQAFRSQGTLSCPRGLAGGHFGHPHSLTPVRVVQLQNGSSVAPGSTGHSFLSDSSESHYWRYFF